MKKRLIIITILLVLLSAALDYYVQSDAFSARLRPYILTPLREVLGPEAHIGMVKANAIPLYLEVRDIVVPAGNSGDAILVRKVRVYINPFPLLVKRISMPTISLLEPRLRATRLRTGEVPLQKLAERIRSAAENNPSTAQTGFKITLGTISVHSGSIAITDEGTNTSMLCSDLTLNVKANLIAENAKVNLKSAAVRVSVAGYPEYTARVKGTAAYERGKIMFSPIELYSPDVTLALSGFIGLLPGSEADLTMKGHLGPKLLGRFSQLLNKPAIKQQGPIIDMTLTAKGTLPEPVLNGSLSLSGLTYQGIMVQHAALSFLYKNRTLAVNGNQWKLAKDKNRITLDDLSVMLDYRESGFDVRNAHVLLGDLELKASGRVDSASGYDAEMNITSRDGSALSFITGFPFQGNAALRGRLSGELSAPVYDGMVTAGPLTVKKILFHDVKGRVQFMEKRLLFSEVDIHQLESRYVLDGSIDFGREEPLYAAHVNVVRSDVVSIVTLFYEPIPLHFPASGAIDFTGSSKEFTGSAALAIGAGSAYGESFTRGTLKVALTSDRISFPQAVVYKGNGVVKGNGWIGFNGTYAATLTSRDVDLSEVNLLESIPVSGLFSLDVNSAGTFGKPELSAVLSSGELRYERVNTGAYRTEMRLERGKLALTSSFMDDRANLTAALELKTPYAWNAEAAVGSVNLSPLLAKAGSETVSRIKILADGQLSLRGKGTMLSALQGSASFPRLSMELGDYRIDNDGVVVLAIEAGKIMVRSLNFIGPGTHIGITGTSRILNDYDLEFIGNANLSLLKILFREVDFADGTADLKLTIREGWNKPELAGDLRVEKGEVKLKDVPQKFSALNGHIGFNQERIIVDSFVGEVGGGKVNVSGWAQLAGVALKDFTTRVVFDSVVVRYPVGFVGTLSGELYYDGNAAEQTLAGDVLIKRALYERRVEWKSMLLETFKGFSQRQKTEIGWVGETQLNIRFHGKDNILIQNNLAKVPIEVDAFIRGTPNQPQLLGRLEARAGGVYFRRNEFKILYASVDFVDPNRINPILDIQAETRVREYTIRLTVSGAADRALISFISDPSLSDTDILSMLALGKTGTELKGKGAEVGMGEAASFATGQFQDIFERRARSLTGLDRFQVDPYLSKDTSVPRVTVGKEIIQDKLYVTYSSNVGATTPEQVLRVEYILDKHFSLVGEQNEVGAIGGDVKFRFEFK